MGLLQQDAGHVVHTLYAQFLIQGSATGCGRVSFYLDHVSIDGCGVLRQRSELIVIFRIDFDLAVSEVDRDFVVDVIIAQLAKAGGIGVNQLLIGGNLLLMRFQLFLVFLQFPRSAPSMRPSAFSVLPHFAGTAPWFQPSQPE
jgi:hypothetical protein